MALPLPGAAEFGVLWAIEAIGTQRTFLVLAAVARAGLGLGLGAALPDRPGRAAGRAGAPVGTTKPAENGRVLYETETPYQYARVVEDADGTRKLELNEGQAIHSLQRPGTVLTDGYWDGFLVLPFATGCGEPPKRIAALGTAGGTVPRAYAHYFPRDARSTRSTSTPSCSRSATATSACATPAAARDRRRTRGRSCAQTTSATTRSSSTPTASPTSRST